MATTTSTESISLPIEGMTCTGCAQSIESALSHAEGVLKVNVNFATETAQVEYAPGKISREDLESVVEKAGYKVKRVAARVDVKIGGMTCAGCVNTVEKALRDAPGVISSTAYSVPRQASRRCRGDLSGGARNTRSRKSWRGARRSAGTRRTGARRNTFGSTGFAYVRRAGTS